MHNERTIMTHPSNTELSKQIYERVLLIASEAATSGVNAPYHTEGLLKLVQAREQQLLSELLGELPEKKDVIMPDYPDKEETDEWNSKQGFNSAIDQVVSVIERLQNKTNDGGQNGG